MSRIPALVAAVLLPAAQPVFLSAAVSTAALVVPQAPAQAQSSEAVGRVAKAITVRIEGATQGSGVLVKREGSRYTVLTAWHVVSSQGPREELDVYTTDGKRHSLEWDSIKQLGSVDMAILSFTSSTSYEVARVGDVKSVPMGSDVFVAGFPLPTTAVPIRLTRFLSGKVVANATTYIPNGYQLLYSNPTLPGMSGGPVLDSRGLLVGIHGQGETDQYLTSKVGIAVKTGINQAVPIFFYLQGKSIALAPLASSVDLSSDDYLAKARSLWGQQGAEDDLIQYASKSLAIKKTSDAYLIRSKARFDLSDFSSARSDLDFALELDPNNPILFYSRGAARYYLQDYLGALADFDRSIDIDPVNPQAFFNRGAVLGLQGDHLGLIGSTTEAIRVSLANPDISFDLITAYKNRGIAYQNIGSQSLACADWRMAANLGDSLSREWVVNECQ